MNIDKSLFPELFEDKLLPWGPIRAVLELDVTPPDELISNVNFVPCVKDKWVVVKHENGWCIVGGTLEPGEGYLDTIKRELMEEAGAVLKTFHLVGAWHCHSLADKPYRPHLPWPEFYRLLAYGEVEISGKPTNPKGAEQVSEVAALSLEEACRRLETKEDDGKQLADSYRLVAALKAQRAKKSR